MGGFGPVGGGRSIGYEAVIEVWKWEVKEMEQGSLVSG